MGPGSRLSSLSLRSKLILVISLLVVVISAATVWVVRYRSQIFIADQFRRDVQTTRKTMQKMIQDRLNLLEKDALAMMHTPRLVAVLELEGPEAQETLRDIMHEVGGLSEFLQSDKGVLMCKPSPDQPGRWIEYYAHRVDASSEEIDRACNLLERRFQQDEARRASWKGQLSFQSGGRDHVYLASAARIPLDRTEVILIYCDEVDAALASELHAPTLQDNDGLLFYWERRLVASALPSLPAAGNQDLERRLDIGQVLQTQGASRQRPVGLRLEEMDYLSSAGYLSDPDLNVSLLDDQTARRGLAYLILKSTGVQEEGIRQLNRDLLLVGAAGLLLAIALATVFSSGLARPIQRLVEFVINFGHGEMERRLNLEQFHGEFSHLAGAFDAMQLSLLQKTRQLVESERLYRTLIENSTQAITGIHASTGKIFAANNAFAELTGYTPAQLDALALPECFFPEEKPVAEELLARLDDEGLVSQQVRMRRKDGKEIFVELKLSVVERSPETTALAVLSDETEKRTLEKQLIQSQKMESLGTLAGGVAHDFNNLLTAIIGFSTMAMKEVKPDQNVYNYLKQVERAGERAKELTHNLLSFGRRKDMRPRPINLNQVVEETVQLLSRTLDKSITLATRLASSLDVVEADAGQMDQVLMNLCINARDAMPDGGAITLETSNHYLDEEYCRTRQDTRPGHYVRLSVTDTGVGMDKETQKRIFEPFFTTKEVGKGTGLGLAIVYGIIKAHHGQLAVYSEVGHGTTFAIDLPAVNKQVRRDVSEAEAVRGGHERVLLVDDEESILMLGGEILSQLGYRVETAANGRQALQKLQTAGPYQLVVMDLVMPEMSGRELFDAILAKGIVVRILIASGYSMHERSQDLLERGADDFIQKPYRPDDLARKVREVLDRGPRVAGAN